MSDISTNSRSRIRLTNLAGSDAAGLKGAKLDTEGKVLTLAVEWLLNEEAAVAAASRSRP